MYHVLAPVDVEEGRVSSQIESILGLHDAGAEVKVDALYVYDEIDAPADEAGGLYIDEINENIEDLQGLPETTDLIRGKLEDAGIETTVHDVVGDPAAAILELAEEFDVDAIVLGTRRRSRVGKALFGSVTQEVIKDSDRPVIATPE